jgi:hypothetical protein
VTKACVPNIQINNEIQNGRKTMKKIQLVIAVAGAMVLSALAVPASAATQDQINQAITNGLVWLVSQQNSNGSWGSSYPVAYTSFAVAKLEDRAFELGYASPFDDAYPYKTNVINGLNYLFSQASTNTTTKGICFNRGSGQETYCTGIGMMAIAASKAPTNIVNVSNNVVNGMTYKAVLQLIVNHFAGGQNPDGGWRYSALSGSSDNSNTGYAVMGLRYAESPLYGFECVIPATLKAALSTNWINAIQDNSSDSNDGGGGYTSGLSGVNLLETGNLLFEMSFVGDNTLTQRVQRAIGYIQTNWNDNNENPGWRPHQYQAMDCMMEGFTSLNITGITIGGINVDWFANFSDAIVASQQSDGSWPADGFGDAMLSTEWALLVLEKVSPRDPLQITPATGFSACGPVGGPFTITNEIFTLTDIGTAPLNWSLANASSWLDASLGGGTLAVGETTNATVCLNSNAYSLPTGIYTATVWFTNLSDGVVQSRQFILTVSGPPIITCPGNITVTITNPAGAVVNYNVTVSGGCPLITTNCVPPSGSLFPMGTTTVNCSATDACGRSNSCNFTVTVSPLPLSITCPSNIAVTTANPSGAVVNYTVTVSGGCRPIITNCVPPSGSLFPMGTTTVNCSATDACGQSNSCSFTVTVSLLPLNVTCPGNIIMTTTSPNGTVFNYTVLISGGCPPYTTNSVPPSGSIFPIGTTNVSWSVTDACGQSNSCSFTVMVVLVSSLSISNVIQSGLTWLVSQQDSDGSWQGSNGYTPVAHTGFAVLKLEEHAFELGYVSPFDDAYQYKTNVINGLNYLFSQAGVPEAYGTGTGICFDQGGYDETRDTGIAMMAIAASRAPTNMVNVTNSIVNGMTYQAVMQSTVDYLAWSQQSEGGWLSSSYPDGVPPDNSNTGYAVLGLYYAESPVYGFACVVPPKLTAELSTNWINAIQVNGGADDGGSCSWHYLSAETNLLYTGNLLFEMSFVGDDTSVPRVQRAIAYIGRNWDDNNEDPGWRPHNYLAMDSLMEGFGTLGITNITVNGISVDWFADFANAIVASQQSDGSWPADSYNGDAILSTELALLVLEKVSPLVDPLRITPATGFTATGPVGGPFTPTNENFTLTNTGTNSLSWTLVNTSVWCNASPGGGTLEAGGTTNVTVSLNTNARSLAAGVYSASVWFTDLNDNVGQSRQFTLAVGPALAIQKATPALRIFAGDNTDINHREELATADQDKSWVGAASASHPTRYSFTLLSYPSNINQTHIFLIPLNFLGDWQWPYGDNHVDYDYASNLVRLVLNPGPNTGSIVACVQWKTNLANAKPNQTALTFTNAGTVGTWTLEFDSDNSGKVTGPDGTNHAFTIADPNVTTDFGGPMVAYFGLQPNGTAGIGQYEDWASILITNVVGGSVAEDFTKYTSRNLSYVWTAMETLPSIVVVSTNDFPEYWVTWTPPTDGFDIGSKTNLLQTGPWISPQFYSGYFDNSPPYGAAQQFGQKMWVLLPEDDLPTADGFPGGPLAPTAVFVLSTNVFYP